MASSKHWHLISYDVRDPARLRRTAKLLESYGNRIQYSVFRCRLDKTMLEKLHWELSRILDEEDDLLVIPLCGSCAGKVSQHSTGDCRDWDETPTFRVI
ncbi:MAG: CRISPR-associated endonuclease Cas2 [bacterium]|nr:CRISPR-associated endonuclease Cas2 [bacterium]